MRNSILALCLLLILTCYAKAQQFVLIGANTTNYPTVSTKVFAFDATGGLIPFSNSGLEVRANNAVIPATVDCDPATAGRSLSLVSMVDISSQTSVGIAPPMDLTKAGLGILPTTMPGATDEIALIQYDQHPTLLSALTVNRAVYTNALQRITTNTGSSLANGLLKGPFGALVHLQNSPNARAVIIYTNNNSKADLANSLSLARTFATRIYIVGIQTRLSNEYKTLADSSGGAWVENIASVSEAQIYTRAFVAHAKNQQSCTVTFNVGSQCNFPVSFSVKSGNVTRDGQATISTDARVRLEFSESGLNFGTVPVGATSDRQITVTARNGDVVITDITSNNPAYSIQNPPITPLLLAKDGSIQLTVRYTSSTVNGVFGTIELASEACGTNAIYARAGSTINGDKLKLLAPNGGEQLLSGTTTNITWTNVLPDDIVRIDVSTNNGTSWLPITENATGLEYKWTPGPLIGTSTRIRVQRTELDPSAIVTMRGQDLPVYSAKITPNGAELITGGHDGTVRIWDAASGAQLGLIGLHTDWVWGIDIHPTLPLVASGSHDGTVRIWDYQTRQRVVTLQFNSRVWSVAFTPDGKTLIVGADNSISIYNTANWTNQSTVVVPGPVYSISPFNDNSRFATAEGTKAAIRTVSAPSSARELTGHTGEVYGVSVSPDNQLIATACADKMVRTFNPNSLANIASSIPSTGSMLAVDFANDNQTLIAGGSDGTGKILSASSLQQTNSLAGHGGPIYSVSFGASGQTVATASTDKTARVWKISDISLTEDISDNAFAIRSGTLSITDHNVGNVTIGTGADKVLPLARNTGSDTLIINSIRISSGDVADFDIISETSKTALSANGVLNAQVNFAPTSAGLKTVTVEVITGTTVSTFEISGNATLPATNAPQAIDFGRVLANTTQVDSTVVLQLPTGVTAPATIQSVVLEGSLEQVAPFSITQNPEGETISTGTFSALQLRFKPTDLGKFTAVVRITFAGQALPTLIKLYGEGTGDASISSDRSLLFDTDICTGTAAPQTVQIRNIGNSTLTIYAAAFEGVDKDEFSIDAVTTPPITIVAGATRTFQVTFTPKRIGVKNAQLVITSNAINSAGGRNVVALVARKDSSGFELSRPVVNFVNIPEGIPETERILVTNFGTTSRRWPATPIVLGQFRIESIVPEITPPGGRSEITIRFLGGEAGQTYQANHVFVDSICGRNVTLQMSASVKSFIGITVRAGNAVTTTGTEISVPVFVSNKINFDRTTVQSLDVVFTVNGTILTPVGSTPLGTLAPNGQRSFKVTVPIPSSDSLATQLRFRTTWGSDSVSAISIDSVSIADTILVRTSNGSVTLSDLCVQGGLRTVRWATQSANMQVSPQPASANAVLEFAASEQGIVRIEVIDAQGRLIQLLADKPIAPGKYLLPLQTTEMNSGTYFIRMTTPTELFVERFDVVK